MNTFATITAQGQLTIPAAFRKRLGIKIPAKVIVREEGQTIVVEPVRDIFSSKGMFSAHALKIPLQKVIEREESEGMSVLRKKYTKS